MEEMKSHQNEIGDFLKSRGVDLNEHDNKLNQELEELMKMEADSLENQLPEAQKKNFYIVKLSLELQNEEGFLNALFA